MWLCSGTYIESNPRASISRANSSGRIERSLRNAVIPIRMSLSPEGWPRVGGGHGQVKRRPPPPSRAGPGAVYSGRQTSLHWAPPAGPGVASSFDPISDDRGGDSSAPSSSSFAGSHAVTSAGWPASRLSDGRRDARRAARAWFDQIRRFCRSFRRELFNRMIQMTPATPRTATIKARSVVVPIPDKSQILPDVESAILPHHRRKCRPSRQQEADPRLARRGPAAIDLRQLVVAAGSGPIWVRNSSWSKYRCSDATSPFSTRWMVAYRSLIRLPLGGMSPCGVRSVPVWVPLM